jgi:hypothetical protein
MAHKVNAIITWAGEVLYSLRKAANFLGITISMVRRWANLDPARNKRNGEIHEEMKGCPYLNGEAIRPVLAPGGYGREIHYYPSSELKRVRKAMSRQVAVPRYPGLTYLDDAVKELRVSVRTVRRLLKKWNSAAKVEKKHGRSRDGLARKRSYVPTEFVEWAKTLHKPLADERMTIKDAARELELSCDAVRYHGRLGRLDMKSEKTSVDVTAGKAKRPAFHFEREGLTVSREKVSLLKQELQVEPVVPPPVCTDKKAAKIVKSFLKNGPLPGSVVCQQAREQGVSQHQVFRVLPALRVRRKRFGHGTRCWCLPGHAPRGEDSQGTQRAMGLFRTRLANGRALRDDLVAEARQQNICHADVAMARRRLGIITEYDTGRVCFWRLPAEEPTANTPRSEKMSAGVMSGAASANGQRVKEITYERERLPEFRYPVYIVQPPDQPVPVQCTNLGIPASTSTESVPVRIGNHWTDAVVLRGGKIKHFRNFSEWKLVQALIAAGPHGLSKDEIENVTSSARRILRELYEDEDWASIIVRAGGKGNRYSLKW